VSSTLDLISECPPRRVATKLKGPSNPYLIDPYGWVHQTPLLGCSVTYAAEEVGYPNLSMGSK
jgi:hypothetical protein